MKVLFVTPEAAPLTKTGGLADVAGSLPGALAELGVEARVLLPGYPQAIANLRHKGQPVVLGNLLGLGETRLIPGSNPGNQLPVWLVDNPALFNRSGGPYQDPSGTDWADNPQRFALLCKVGALLGDAGGLLGWQPDLLHAQDWQCGLAPAYLAMAGNRHCHTLFTIHNMEYQGAYHPALVKALGLPDCALAETGLGHNHRLSFLKAGLYYSERLTTVSPTYAKEIRTPEHGFGMEALLESRFPDLTGILNGIDPEVWNPETDPHIARNYGVETLADKAANKSALQRDFGVAVDPDAPLLGVVSRLVSQKGIDLVVDNLPRFIGRGLQLVVLGAGDPAIEKRLVRTAAIYPGLLGVKIGYDEALAHRIQAGADMLLVPSRFEPCGLTQLYAMRYGTIPVGRKTGGLADTIIDYAKKPDLGTGFLFEKAAADDLHAAVEGALALFASPHGWSDLQRRAMDREFSWKRAAEQHLDIYRDVTHQT